jgi:hypothetical protein
VGATLPMKDRKAMEKVVLNAWSLGLDCDASLESDALELGANSLDVLRIAALIVERLGLDTDEITAVALIILDHPTPHDFLRVWVPPEGKPKRYN